MGRAAVRALPLALVILLMAAAAPPSVEKAVGLYRKYDIARTSDYDPDPIFPWIEENIHKPGVLLARDSANNAIPAYSTALNVVSQRGEGMIRDREGWRSWPARRSTSPNATSTYTTSSSGPPWTGKPTPSCVAIVRIT